MPDTMSPRAGSSSLKTPVFWEIGQSQDGKNALSNPQALNSYGYANDNPITGKDPNGRQYADFSGSYTVPVYGVPIGPTVGFYLTPGTGDPYVYFGVTVAGRPGPSGSIMYSPSGSPSEGWGGSISGFTRGLGGQVGYSQDSNGKFRPSGEAGIGTAGVSGSITYTVQLGKLLDYIGGPLENVTTPMTYNSTKQKNISSPKQQSFGFAQNSTRGPSAQSRQNSAGSQSFAQQVASIQAQINSIQAQINQIKASQNR
jgi:hypothetical protein